MKEPRKNWHSASALQIALVAGLIPISAILLVIAAPANSKEAPLRDQLIAVAAGDSTTALGNYPSTSVMLSGDVTVTPDATPTNTTSINVSTSTNFKGTFAASPTTGVVTVTDGHPAGTYTVTVRGFNAGILTATKTFTLIVTAPAACPTVSFAAGVNFCIGGFPQKVAVGDFNGDGRQDIAAANALTAGFVSILLGDGAGYFSVATNFSVGNSPSSVAVGDFNGDGKQDLAVSNSGSNNVSILLGDGAGHFGPPTNFATGSGSRSVAVSDFNGDGKQDLAVTNGSSNNVSILLGDGAGNFGTATNFATGAYPDSVAVGDFNGDGKQDLATANGDSDNVSILLGDGAGSFILFASLAVGTDPYSVTVGDFNGDGSQDLAVSNYLPHTVSILLGDGAGHFSGPTVFGLGGAAFSIQVGDFNGDGKQDLVAARGGVDLLLGDGAGNFSAPLHFPGGGGPYSVAVGDFNGDGRQDFVLGNPLDNVSILLRSCPGAPTPTPTPTATATGTPPPLPTLGSYPDTSIPLSTDMSVSPDAAPVNTTSINVSTSTSFMGTLEGDPNTGAVRVTDAHPAGTYTLTVTAFNGSGATATRTFALTVTTPPTCNPVTFAAGNFSVGAPYSVATGDFNRDGKQDLAVASTGGFASILLGDGAGHFSALTNFNVATHIESVAVGDFNGDGKEDLAVADPGTESSCEDRGGVWVLLGDGSGNFSAGTIFRDGINPRSVAVGDFNNDGRQDLAVANGSSDNVSIFLGDGAGSFSALRNFAADNTPISVAVGDFNRDGNQDLAVANANSFDVSILLGDGTGHFGAPTTLGAGALPYSVAVGDFTGDGKQDLAVANYGSNNVSIFLGDGAGNFNAATNFLADCGPYSVATGDFNGDGKQDLAVANGCPQNPGSVSILLGNGAGNFSAPTNFGAGNGSRSVAVGDFTGDGRQDLAVANLGSNNVSILLRSCAPTPTATPTATATVSPCPPVITQSTSQAITTTKDPCRYGPTGGFAQTENSYWRAFNMGTFVGGAAQYNVSAVSFGVFSVAYAGPPPPAVTVRLYGNTGAPFPGGTRTLLGSSTITVTAGTGTVVTTPLVATVPAGTPELVMELFTPDGIADRYLFNVGANEAPETGLSYWSSLCNSTPEVMSGHLVFNVYGTCSAGTSPPTATPSATATPTATATVTPVPTATATATATTTPAPTPSPSPTPAAQALNLSTRMLVQVGANVGIGGFIITPSKANSGSPLGKQVVLRAIGPSLAQFGVPNLLVDPVLELHGPAGFTTIINDNWRATQEAELIATGVAPADNLESAILTTLDPGAYTAIVSGKNNTLGVALIEVYDLSQTVGSRLGNISTRAFVSTGSNVVIAGFILGGHGGNASVILRGIGPSLTALGVPDALANPALELRDSNGSLLRANNDWQDDPIQAALISAAGLAPTNNSESAMVSTLPPGLYTALLSGLNGGTGVGLVEVYAQETP